jgi:transcriptional regulator with XRE-family HTH domain
MSKTPTRTKQRSASKHDAVLGTKIRVRRVEIGMSQATLGDKLGVSFQQIQKYEKGVNRVSHTRLVEISAALNIGMDYFTASEGKGVSELTSMLADSASQRLLRAFHKIGDMPTRYKFVGLLESITH